MSSIQVRWASYDWSCTEDEEAENFDVKPKEPKRWNVKEFGDRDEDLIPALAFFLKQVQDPRFDWVELRSDLTGWDFLTKDKREFNQSLMRVERY